MDEVVAAGAVDPKSDGAELVGAKENGELVGAAVCVPKPPNIGAAVAVEVAGAPKIFVAVDVAGLEPKPVKAGVVVAPPNIGAAVFVVLPNKLVVAGCAPNGLVATGALVVELGKPKILLVDVGAVVPNGVDVVGCEKILVLVAG